MLVSPFGFGTLVNQSASYTFKEVLSFHEVLTDRIVGNEAILCNLLLGLLYGPEGNVRRYWTLLLYSFLHFCVKRVFILLEFLKDFIYTLAVEYITNIVLIFNNSISWRLVISQ
jgi:hypothetical protein